MPRGKESEKEAEESGYLIDELRKRYSIFTFLLGLAKFPRSLSLTIRVGGLRSESVTGFTEIQKLAIKGNNTIEKTSRNVGKRRR
tara:strand:- start:238 stop:492 length:255 start_codon:yes stop_codon:yes gene_type:complete